MRACMGACERERERERERMSEGDHTTHQIWTGCTCIILRCSNLGQGEPKKEKLETNRSREGQVITE